MVFWCCCAQANTQSQEWDNISVDENLSYRFSEEPPAPLPALLSSQPRWERSRGSVHDPKLKLIDQEARDEPVDFFATSAARSRKCKCLSEDTGARTEIEYFVDADLGQLVVQKSGQAGQLETVICPVMSIMDIYTINDGEDCFPRHLMKSIAPEEKAGLLTIVHAREDLTVDPFGLCLVEASQAARDDLLRHLKKYYLAHCGVSCCPP